MKQSKNYHETVRDKLTLSPIDKYIKHNRYPYKMVLSIALVVLSTLCIINFLNTFSRIGLAQIGVWENVCDFIPDTDRVQTFYTADEFQDHLQTLLVNLNNLDKIIFQKIDDSEARYEMEVYPIYPIIDSNSENENGFYQNNYSFPIDIRQGILSPFNLSNLTSLKNFIQKTNKFIIHLMNFRLYMRTPQNLVDLSSCWSIDLRYYYLHASYVTLDLSYSFQSCNINLNDSFNISNNQINNLHDSNERNLNESEKVFFESNKNSHLPLSKASGLQYTEKFLGDSIITFHLLICLLASTSLILNLKYIYEMMQVYLETIVRSKEKKLFSESINPTMEEPIFSFTSVSEKQEKSSKTIEDLLQKDKPWYKLTFKEKMLFFDFWFVWGVIGNVVQIWGSLLHIMDELAAETFNRSSENEILVGFGCFFAWFNMMKYLEYNKSIFNISNLLTKSLPDMFSFMIGIIPLFLGFTFLGVTLFWKNEAFKNVNEAIMTLACLSFGDNQYIFISQTQPQSLISLFYFFIYQFFFFIAIQNIFISIICAKAREKEKKPASSNLELQNEKMEPNLSTPPLSPANDFLTSSAKASLDSDFLLGGQSPKAEEPGWRRKTIKRMQTMTSNNEKDPIVVSQALRQTLTRRLTNTLKRTDFVGENFKNLATSMQLKKYGSEQMKDLEFLVFEKNRIEHEVVEYNRILKKKLKEFWKDAIEDLEFYNLKYEDNKNIKMKYYEEVDSIILKIEEILSRKMFMHNQKLRIV